MLIVWAGGLLLIGIALTSLLFWRIHPFLAVYAPVEARILVVDGWLPDYALKAAADEFQHGAYQTLITVGAPLAQGFYLLEYQTHAHLAAATLAKLGIPAEKIISLPVPYAARDRTFTAALGVKDWLQAANLSASEPMNLYTLGTHARRSRLLFQRAFPPQTPIGILQTASQNYQPDRWWQYSAGVRDILFESIAYLYALLFVFKLLLSGNQGKLKADLLRGELGVERAFWLAWSQIDGVGAVLLRRLHLHFGTLSAAWDASPSALEAIDGLGEFTAAAIAARRSALNPLELLDRHLQTNPHFWTPADPEYPHLLLEMPDPPPVLYYRGKVEPRENQGHPPTIALVGTRNPSEYGRRWTEKLTVALVNAGYTIVSGLAEGVDTVAHRSCLQAGGRTIAALGTGVDVVYPWSNRKLAQQVAQTGLLISEYPAGTQPDRVNFPRRNRIIAGLCRVTLVLEAPRKSGALITARLANDYGREVYVLPGSLDNPRCLGCLELLNQGAHLILGVEELLEALGELPALDSLPAFQRSLFEPSTAPLAINLDPPLDQVFQVISTEPASLDRIVQQTDLATELVSSALLQLELMGLVAQLPGMQYCKVG